MHLLLLLLFLSFIGTFFLPADNEGAEPPSSLSKAVELGTDVAGAALESAGLTFLPMPSSGCSSSILKPEKVADLLDLLPHGQATLLSKVMTTSQDVWSAQFYSGPAGIGLCFPYQDRLLVLSGVELPDMPGADEWKELGDKLRNLY